MSEEEKVVRNLILTCGKSQIDGKNKMSMLGTGQSKWSEVRRYIEGLRDERSVYDTWWQDDQDVQNYSQRIAEVLARKWHEMNLNDADAGPRELDRRIGNTNPFGAEISTLYKMTVEQPPAFDPNWDKLVLLYSDTQSGAFCVSVLHKLLTHEQTWRIPPERIVVRRVKGLMEEPPDVKIAEKSLDEEILTSRREDITNIFVITGGFKSVTPIITVYALVYKEDLYYLFENSTQLRKLELPAQVRSSGRWWTFGRTWRKAEDQHRVIVTVRTGEKGEPAEPDDPPL